MDRGLSSASGIEAKKMPEFLETRRGLISCTNFLLVLDVLLASKSKPWYMKAVRKMTLASQNVVEMESCTKHLEEWCRYWPMAISRNELGEVDDDVQGESFPENQVILLLDGKWNKVNWVELLQMYELWTDKVRPGEGTFVGTYARLCGVRELIFKTMKLLKLARDGESSDSLATVAGFISKVIRLERRSRALPKGTPARRSAVENVVAVFEQGLKEFGERWAKQWTKPTNYSESLVTTFADKGCFVMRRFEKLDKVADDLHDYADVLPILFEGGTFTKQAEPSPKQRLNYKGEESLEQGKSPANRETTPYRLVSR